MTEQGFDCGFVGISFLSSPGHSQIKPRKEEEMVTKKRAVLIILFIVCPVVGFGLVYPEVGQHVLGISFIFLLFGIAAKAAGDIRKEQEWTP